MPNKKYDIHERIFKFVVRVLKLVRSLPKTQENYTIISQLLDSATSMGANDREADGASSTKDFIHCYTVVRKETNETLYWLQLISEINPAFRKRMTLLLQENEEIFRIVSSIVFNTKSKTK